MHMEDFIGIIHPKNNHTHIVFFVKDFFRIIESIINICISEYI
jgi:hypothetical protein